MHEKGAGHKHLVLADIFSGHAFDLAMEFPDFRRRARPQLEAGSDLRR